MGVYTCTIPTIRSQITISDAPPCKCGGAFVFHHHTHKRKKSNEGVTAECPDCGAQYYDWDEKSVIEKINKWQSTILK